MLRYLIRYCDEKYYGERWPDQITPEIIVWMSKKSNIPINIEKMEIYKNGYIIKCGVNYELTHEFITMSLVCCSISSFPLIYESSIDFARTGEFVRFLENKLLVKSKERLIFLSKVLEHLLKSPGPLTSRELERKTLKKIAEENNLDPRISMTDEKNDYLLRLKEHNNGFISCSLLVLCAYCAIPKFEEFKRLPI